MKKTILILSVIALTACNNEEPKSVDYYKNNIYEAEKVLSECKQKNIETENCKNAKVGIFRNKEMHSKSPKFKTNLSN